MWSLAVRQAVKVNGSTYEKPSNPHTGGHDAVILSTDANPSPGFSRVSSTFRSCVGLITHALCRRSPLGILAAIFRLPRGYLELQLEPHLFSKVPLYCMSCQMLYECSSLVSPLRPRTDCLLIVSSRWHGTSNHQGPRWKCPSAQDKILQYLRSFHSGNPGG